VRQYVPNLLRLIRRSDRRQTAPQSISPSTMSTRPSCRRRLRLIIAPRQINGFVSHATSRGFIYRVFCRHFARMQNGCLCLSLGCEAWTLYRRHIKALEAFQCAACRASLVSAGGTEYHTLSCSSDLSQHQLNIFSYRDNCVGSGMYQNA